MSFAATSETDEQRQSRRLGERYGVKDLVDAQVHVWLADTAEHPWPKGLGRLPHKPYPVPAESILLQMDLAGVDRAVIVPPSWQGDSNDVALVAAKKYPHRFAVMGRLDVLHPASAAKLANWRVQPGMLGIRCFLHKAEEREAIRSHRLDALWATAASAEVPVTIMLPGLPDAAELFERMVARNPTLKVSIDHLNLTFRPDDIQNEISKLVRLAKYPNLAVKATGLPGRSRQRYPFRDVHDAIKACYDAFGPKRVFWGADLTHAPCTYYECITMFTEHLPWLAGEDLQWVMGRGVCEWYHWRE